MMEAFDKWLESLLPTIVQLDLSPSVRVINKKSCLDVGEMECDIGFNCQCELYT